MKIYLAEEIFRAPLIDILGGPTQVFQSSPWLIMDQLTDVLSRADFALVPHDAAFWDSAYVDSLRRISEKVPLIYFNRSDFPISLHIPNSFSLQNHFSGPTGANQVIIPYNVKSLDHLPKRSYSKVPTLSFAGYVPRLISRSVLLHLKHNSIKGIVDSPNLVRNFGIHRLADSTFPKNILLRSHYGGARSLIGDVKEFRREYEASIHYSDFVFSPRGVGNSSQRFYEVLSAGRIPIVPNTNQIYPVVKGYNLQEAFLDIARLSSNLDERVHEHWSQMNVMSYLSIQDEIRAVFKKHLAYKPFLKRLFRNLAEERTLLDYVVIKT